LRTSAQTVAASRFTDPGQARRPRHDPLGGPWREVAASLAARKQKTLRERADTELPLLSKAVRAALKWMLTHDALAPPSTSNSRYSRRSFSA
jgi:hypothetical protein